MTFDEIQSEILWPKLDKYKEAWMNDENIVNVQALKTSLTEQIKEVADEHIDKAVDYFESQCDQIEARWNRPVQEKIN